MCIIHLCSALREFLPRLQHQPPGAVFAALTPFLHFLRAESSAEKTV